MNPFELRRLEQQLREALQDTTLSWVLDDVDAAIAAGVPEEKILRRRQQRRGDDSPATSPAAAAARYEVVDRSMLGLGEYESSRKGGTLVIATRAMTDEERVQLLLDAVKRVLVDLPEMELEVLKTLRSEPEATPAAGAWLRVSYSSRTKALDRAAAELSSGEIGSQLSNVHASVNYWPK